MIRWLLRRPTTPPLTHPHHPPCQRQCIVSRGKAAPGPSNSLTSRAPPSSPRVPPPWKRKGSAKRARHHQCGKPIDFFCRHILKKVVGLLCPQLFNFSNYIPTFYVAIYGTVSWSGLKPPSNLNVSLSIQYKHKHCLHLYSFVLADVSHLHDEHSLLACSKLF